MKMDLSSPTSITHFLLTFVVPYNSTSLCMSKIFSSRVTNFSTLSISKAYLSQCFNMKDLGILKYLLGIEVGQIPSGLFLCQRKYTLDIILETGLLGAKPATFPIEHNP